MKLIIDIDEDTYRDIKKGKVYSSMRDVPQESVLAIANGTTIPDNPLEVLKAFYPNISISTEEDLPTNDLFIRIGRSEALRNEVN